MILLLIYFGSSDFAVAQDSEKIIPKEVVEKVLFETNFEAFLHYDLPERKTLYLSSKLVLDFKSIPDQRVKVIKLETKESPESLNIIEISSWDFIDGVYKLSINYNIEGVISWFEFSNQDGKWKLLDYWISET